MKNTTFAEKVTLAGIIFVFALIVVTVTFGIKRENEEVYSTSSLEYVTADSDTVSTKGNTEESVASKTESAEASAVSPSAPSELININEAAAEKLCDLPGIGEKKAAAIIEYRELNGKFKTVEDIKNVSGIGDATYEKLKSLITVE